MTMLSNTIVTTAVTAVVSTPLQMRPMGGASSPGLTAQSNFIYGSGGTSGTVWVQTSLDDGLTWCDAATFAFTTSSSRQALALGSLLTVATSSAIPLTDGTASAGSVSGLIGSLWRTKLTTAGTYAGGTTLRVDIDGIAFTSQS